MLELTEDALTRATFFLVLETEGLTKPYDVHKHIGRKQYTS